MNRFARFASLLAVSGLTLSAQTYTFEVFAGSSSRGYVNGTGSEARFTSPLGVAVDAAGGVYVADGAFVRKISSGGVVTTFAGSTVYDFPIDAVGTFKGSFGGASAVAVDAAGNVYVAETNYEVVRKVTPAGVVTTLAGGVYQRGSTDGAGSAARFFAPYGVAVDSAGNVYVADTGNRTLRKITPAGVVSTMAGRAGETAHVDGPGAIARFEYPAGVAVDAAGNVYVADLRTVRKVTPDGAVSTLAGNSEMLAIPGGFTFDGSADGVGSAARFSMIYGIAVDGPGNVYVAETYSNQTIRKITPAGVVSTLAGGVGQRGAVNGPGSAARFSTPWGLAVDATGNVYVADSGNFAIRKVSSASEVTTLAGRARGSADGVRLQAQFLQPYALAKDAAGNLFVAETGSNTIRKITPEGVVTTVAGIAGQTGRQDGPTGISTFAEPRGLVVDSAGNLLVADYGSHTIRRITPDGVVTTFAGNGGWGNADGVGRAAYFQNPEGLALDSVGNLYVADSNNHAIRKVTPAGVVTTIRNNTAPFYYPHGVAVDGAGFFYVAALQQDHTFNKVLFKMTPTGVVTTLAGSSGASGSADGLGGVARFNAGPRSPSVDRAGNVYVVDGDRVRKVTAAGLVSTVTTGLSNAEAVTVDANGDLWVADTGNDTILRGRASAPLPRLITTQAASQTVVAGGNAQFNIAATGSGLTYQWVRNGSPVAGATQPSLTIANAQAADEALYAVYVTSGAAVEISAGVTLTVLTPPVIQRPPVAQSVLAAGAATFTVAATGSAPLTYQWRKDGEIIPGATAATLTIRSAQPSDVGNYTVTVTNAAGFATSSSAALAIVAPAAPSVGTQPVTRPIADGGAATLTVAATGFPLPTVQWEKNGVPLSGATQATLALNNVGAADAGLYTAVLANSSGVAVAEPVILGVDSNRKVSGAGSEFRANIVFSNGNVFDQVLLEGAAATITADPTQITRLSYIDLDDDIVQVEFSGPGSVSLVLDNPSGPALPLKYNQAVNYMKGHARIVVTGAGETTHLSVFSVGRRNAADQSLFDDAKSYDGVADLAYIAISSPTGKFGGLRVANASFYATRGYTGIYAPGVNFTGPVFVNDISAVDAATPVLQIGSALETRITGGSLLQANNQPVRISGIAQLKFTSGANSHGVEQPAQENKARFVQDGREIAPETIVLRVP